MIMASELLLASAGEDVRLWAMPDLNLHSVKNVPGNSVKYCTCSNNGQLIAYSNEGQGIKVSSLLNENSTLWDIPTAFEQSNVAFSNSSRYLVSGGKDCVVNVWDIKSKSIKRTFRDHINPVSFCVFNFNDKIVASSSDQGEIILTEVSTGLSSEPLLGVDTETINCLQYSHFTHNLLASAGGSGAVTLWDTTEKKLLRTFGEHNSSSTSLSFSPLNDMLLSSTGLDKRIIFYDVCFKKIVKTINTEEPLTCCDFLHDGTTVAVGSISGHIFLFDLRHGATPLKVIPAHRTSVRSTSFQKLVKEKSSKRQASQESKVEKSLSTSNRIQTTDSPVETVQPLSKPSRHSLHLDYVSHEHLENLERLGDESWCEKAGQPAENLLSPQPKYSKVNNEFFSPLELDSVRKPVKRSKSALKKFDVGSRNQNSRDNINPTPSLGARSKSGLSKLSLLSRSTGDLSKSTDKKAKENEQNVASKKNKDGQKDLHESKKGLFKSPFRKKTDNSRPSDESETSSVESMSIDDKTFARGTKSQMSVQSNTSDNVFIAPSKKPINELKQVISDLHESISDDAIDPSTKTLTPQPSPQSGAVPSTEKFQIDFVHKMIDEAMEDNRIAVHKDMVNMQVELIRQMEIQKEQIRQMLECYSINNDLVSEIQRLRAENDMLKRKY